ncbi:MAG TPA: redoxin domain-containing protein [Abditibacterium sp.]
MSIKFFTLFLALGAFSAAQAQIIAPSVQTRPLGAVSDAARQPFNPAAVAILDQSAAAYAKLNGLAMDFSTFDDDKGKITRSNGKIEFSRGGLAKVSGKMGGANLVFQSDGEKIFLHSGAPVVVSRYVDQGEALPQVLGFIPSGLSLVLPFLAVGENPLASEEFRWQGIELLPDNGVGMITRPRAGLKLTMRLYFDARDALLRRAEVEILSGRAKTLNLTAISNLEINPQFTTDNFAFKLPSGARVETQTPTYDPKLRVGTMPYPLLGSDLNGKTVDLEKYAGKVVLLDFWATWCAPCVAEVPNLLQNLQNYRESGFEIVGVSLDEDKAALQAFVKARGLNYPHLFDGKGPANANAQKYGVLAIPFTLLIGKDGKIAAVNPRGRRLEPAIVKALAQ